MKLRQTFGTALRASASISREFYSNMLPKKTILTIDSLERPASPDLIEILVRIFSPTRDDISQIYNNNFLFVCFFFVLKKCKKNFEKSRPFWDVTNFKSQVYFLRQSTKIRSDYYGFMACTKDFSLKSINS